jgi:hypothetical protein
MATRRMTATLSHGMARSWRSCTPLSMRPCRALSTATPVPGTSFLRRRLLDALRERQAPQPHRAQRPRGPALTHVRQPSRSAAAPSPFARTIPVNPSQAGWEAGWTKLRANSAIDESATESIATDMAARLAAAAPDAPPARPLRVVEAPSSYGQPQASQRINAAHNL